MAPLKQATRPARSPLKPIARNLVREFKRHLRAAELPEATRFYDLLHASASLLITEGLPITAVSEMLGYALTSTTLST